MYPLPHKLRTLLAVSVTVLLLLTTCCLSNLSFAAQRYKMWHSKHATIWMPGYGGWSRDGTCDEPGTEVLLLGIDLDRKWCFYVDGRGAFKLTIQHNSTKEVKIIHDCGIKVREGNTFGGWRETLVTGDPISIHWNDDQQMRQRYRERLRASGPIPTRILVYVRASDAMGGRQSWTILKAEPLPQMTGVRRCVD